jgi:Protein of unknown function (DUF2845)
MKKILPLLFLSSISFADDAFYCPVHQAYIKVGMSEADVINACGPPANKQTSQNPSQKIPLTQLLYTINNPYLPSAQHGVGLPAIYQVWSLSSDYQNQTSTNVTFNISNNKVMSIQINGSSTNAASICSNGSVAVGDNVSNVYSSCGSPSHVNQTYINQYLGRNATGETWMYQFGAYQPTLSLTFINGTLQSIN